MTDWRLSQLHASCPRPYPPSAALPFPLQPSFDRKQEAARLVSVLSRAGSTLSNDTNWSPLTAENEKQHAFWLSGKVFFFLIRWSTLEIPALSLSWHVSRLSRFLPELILPSSLNLALLRHLCIWHRTEGAAVLLPRRCSLAVSHVGSTFFTVEIVGGCSD